MWEKFADSTSRILKLASIRVIRRICWACSRSCQQNLNLQTGETTSKCDRDLAPDSQYQWQPSVPLSLWKSHIYLSVLEKCREHDVMVWRALRATAERRLYENQLWGGGGGETQLKLSVTCSAQIRDTSRTEKHSIRRDFITALHSKHKTITLCHHVFVFFFFCGHKSIHLLQ